MRSASWYVELYNFVRASEREPRVDALIFSEPVQAGPADGLERRVAAMDRAARGSVVPAAAQSFHEPVPSFPHIQCREFDVCASPGEPVYRCLSCVMRQGTNWPAGQLCGLAEDGVSHADALLPAGPHVFTSPRQVVARAAKDVTLVIFALAAIPKASSM